MKPAANQVASILRSPTQFVGLLVYGEDWGLVRERARMAIDSVLGSGRDPFRFSTLVREEHNRLPTEVGSLALGGGRRVVHVYEATDGLASVLDKLHARAADVLLVLEAGELPTRSKLRAFAERETAWAAIPCYASKAGSLAAEISAQLKQAKLTITPDALTYLAEELSGESIIRRSELEKLSLYAAGSECIDLETARLCCAGSLETSLGAAVSEAFAGRAARCDAFLAELEREGASGAGILAVLSMQLYRMLKVRVLLDGGASGEEACRTLAPPLYPRQVAAFLEELRRWSSSSLEALGRAVREADIACKRGGSPDFAIAANLLRAVSAHGGGRR